MLAPSAREQTRAVTHVRIRPRARARASPREAGDGRGGQGAAQTWRKRDLGQGRLGLGGRKCRRGPGTRTRRVVDVRDARGWARGLRGVGWGRQASAGRPESCDPGATHLSVPRWVGGRPDGDGVQRAGSGVKARGALGRKECLSPKSAGGLRAAARARACAALPWAGAAGSLG